VCWIKRWRKWKEKKKRMLLTVRMGLDFWQERIYWVSGWYRAVMDDVLKEIRLAKSPIYGLNIAILAFCFRFSKILI